MFVEVCPCARHASHVYQHLPSLVCAKMFARSSLHILIFLTSNGGPCWLRVITESSGMLCTGSWRRMGSSARNSGRCTYSCAAQPPSLPLPPQPTAARASWRSAHLSCCSPTLPWLGKICVFAPAALPHAGCVNLPSKASTACRPEVANTY